MSRNGIVVAIVVALVVAGGWYVYDSFFKTSTASSFQSMCVEDDCGWIGNVTVRLGDPYPPMCPKCKKGVVYDLSVCRKCGHKQILNEVLRQVPGKENLPETTKCDNCGGPMRHGD